MNSCCSRTATLLNPGPDLEMNSCCSRTATLLNPGLILKWTHVAHIRPRCWTLVWSWNELTLLTYGHVAESWPDLEMNSRCWTNRLKVQLSEDSGQKWWMHSLFSETRQRKNVVFLVITNWLKVQLSEDSGQKWWMHSLFSETRQRKNVVFLVIAESSTLWGLRPKMMNAFTLLRNSLA